ncbi:phosphorylase [Thauera sp. 2A1]|uniref:ATP adenylyltransferase family protein n=1 Tax=Thauera sp. 2A1 TaxID=2570191 RepID=UPI00129277B0|nr:phosphorylase [Thauera sp. 2A1]KAI5912855.1 phosphorylase [Thauera sp. 2A1]
MKESWMEAVDARSAQARASGALQPVQAEQTEMEDAGIGFTVRWVSSLAVKDAAKVAIPGGPRDPNFNPFLNPDPELTVGLLGDAHVVILNKFPLSDRHLVLARRAFEEQLVPLARSDFAALATIMAEAGGLGLYNGGTAAGASQRHKHVQWLPEAEGNASLQLFGAGLPAGLPEQGVARHPALPMKHVFIRVRCGRGVGVDEAADSLFAGYRCACDELGLFPGADGLLPPCNLLAGDGWLMMIPRSQECFEGISISAICYGGTLYTRQREQIESIRRVGPLQALAAVGC